jgi:hypothetical protein
LSSGAQCFDPRHKGRQEKKRAKEIDDAAVQATGKSQEFMDGCKLTVIMLKSLALVALGRDSRAAKSTRDKRGRQFRRCLPEKFCLLSSHKTILVARSSLHKNHFVCYSHRAKCATSINYRSKNPERVREEKKKGKAGENSFDDLARYSRITFLQLVNRKNNDRKSSPEA